MLAELLGDDDAQSPVNEMIGVNKNPIKKLMADRKTFKSDAQKRAEGYEKIAKEEAKAKKKEEKEKRKRLCAGRHRRRRKRKPPSDKGCATRRRSKSGRRRRRFQQAGPSKPSSKQV